MGVVKILPTLCPRDFLDQAMLSRYLSLEFTTDPVLIIVHLAGRVTELA